MSTQTRFSDVKERLAPAEVFQSTEHDWKTQNSNRWKGSCPWHGSKSGTCFSVDPDRLLWKCFHCDRGGGPIEYVAELEGVGMGAGGQLDEKEFIRAWEALADHAGCEGPSESREGRTYSRHSRTPRGRASDMRQESHALSGPGGQDSPSQIETARRDTGPDLDTPEEELRQALKGYREALKQSEKAQSYVRGRGLSVKTLLAYGCGFAPAGEWIGPDKVARLVTPHTTPASDGSGGRLVNLLGRYLGECSKGRRHRHVPGNSTALFNAPAIAEGGSPLVVCEGPLDALSFIEAGWERTLALHNTDPSSSFWEAIRGSVDAVLFAFDADETGRKDAQARVREAKMKAYKADTLHDKPTYAGYEDPNEALQAGDLSLHYLRELSEETPAEASEQPVEGAKHEEVLTPSSNQRGADGPDSDYEPSDLISYWDGGAIGYLGRWIWERSPAPMGEAGKGLYADQALHEWIATELQAGSEEAEDPERLRRVLWRLYATFGPEDIAEEVFQHHCDDVPEQSRSGSVWRDRDRDPYRVGRLPSSVEVWRVTAPKEPRATSGRGIAIDSPYSEAFIQDLKVLPEWGREWRGSEKVWVVDDCFAAFAGDLLRSHFAT